VTPQSLYNQQRSRDSRASLFGRPEPLSEGPYSSLLIRKEA